MASSSDPLSGQDSGTIAAPPKTASSEDLSRAVEQRRRDLGIDALPPEKPIGAVLPRIQAPPQKPVKPPPTEEELAARDAFRRQQEREAAWTEFANLRGCRYAECRLQTFAAVTDPQKAAVAALREYCESAKDNVRAGNGIVLFGPRGTGKDHLAMAVARAVIIAGGAVVWRNGMDLFGDIRDSMGDDDAKESRLVEKLVRPDLLYLSDPLPLVGALSPHQMNMLFRILDGRYSRRRATLCTVNVANGAELDDRMGAQNADRLKDGALAIYCNWESYRRTR